MSNLESYSHRFAKELMVKWLRDAADAAAAAPDWQRRDPPDHWCHNPDVTFGGPTEISWRINRGPPHWRVWLEYPFTENQSYHCWDETNNKYVDRPPTRDDLQRKGMPASYIVDIAIQHKGNITDVIEIVHKHPLNPKKIEFLSKHCLGTIWQIPASWILGQVGVPITIPRDFIIDNRPQHVRVADLETYIGETVR